MSQPESVDPPHTGHAVVDRVLADATAASRQPLDDRAEALGAVHERLHAALDPDADPADPGPGVA